jgi:hypothetical protein
VPFIWQPYRQTENSHAEKMQAWLQRLTPAAAEGKPLSASPVNGGDALAAWQKFHWVWNGLAPAQTNAAPEMTLQKAWQDLCQAWPETRSTLHQTCTQLALQTSLEDNLIESTQGFGYHLTHIR